MTKAARPSHGLGPRSLRHEAGAVSPLSCKENDFEAIGTWVPVSHPRLRFDGGNYKSVDTFNIKLRPADVSGSMTATLPFAAGPQDVQLGEFQDGGSIGNQMLGERTVTIKN